MSTVFVQLHCNLNRVPFKITRDAKCEQYSTLEVALHWGLALSLSLQESCGSCQRKVIVLAIMRRWCVAVSVCLCPRLSRGRTSRVTMTLSSHSSNAYAAAQKEPDITVWVKISLESRWNLISERMTTWPTKSGFPKIYHLTFCVLRCFWSRLIAIHN